MSEQIDLNDMYLFAKVIVHGGYSAASRVLGIATSRLSRRVSELERQLGVRLLNRTTRSISLTPTGETFYQHCLVMVAEAEAAREAIEQTRAMPQGEIRLSCPVGVLLSDVSAIVARFLTDNPAVRITLDATNRRVDIVEEGFDLAIRVRVPPLEDSELTIRTLGTSPMSLVCSRWFVAQHGLPISLDDLSHTPTLSMRQSGGRYSWQFVDAEGVRVEVHHGPRLATDDLSSLLAAALEGIGVALLPDALVAKHLAGGTLVAVLPSLRTLPGVIHAVFPSRRGMIPAVRALLDALAKGLGNSVLENAGGSIATTDN